VTTTPLTSAIAAYGIDLASLSRGPVEESIEQKILRLGDEAAPPLVKAYRRQRDEECARQHAGPPCWRLFTDPHSLLREKQALWPTAICPGLARISTQGWATFYLIHLALGMPENWRHALDCWASLWPLPIGQCAVRDALEQNPALAHLDEAQRHALIGAAPLPWHETAGLILSPWRPQQPFCGDLRIAVLTEPNEHRLAQVVQWGSGPAQIPDEVQRLANKLQRLVERLSGKVRPSSANAGRPRALGDMTLGEMRELLLSYTLQYRREERKWPKVKQYRFILGVGKTAFYDYFERHGTSWRVESETLRQEVLKQMGRISGH